MCHSMDVEVREQYLGVSSSGDQAQPVGLEDKSTSYILSHLACPTKCICCDVCQSGWPRELWHHVHGKGPKLALFMLLGVFQDSML